MVNYKLYADGREVYSGTNYMAIVRLMCCFNQLGFETKLTREIIREDLKKESEVS